MSSEPWVYSESKEGQHDSIISASPLEPPSRPCPDTIIYSSISSPPLHLSRLYSNPPVPSQSHTSPRLPSLYYCRWDVIFRNTMKFVFLYIQCSKWLVWAADVWFFRLQTWKNYPIVQSRCHMVDEYQKCTMVFMGYFKESKNHYVGFQIHTVIGNEEIFNVHPVFRQMLMKIWSDILTFLVLKAIVTPWIDQ